MKHRTPKLIALDLDGTLLSSNKGLSERTIDAVHQIKAKGIQVMVCTGRPPRSARTIIEALDVGALAALYNGALIYDFQQQRQLTSFTMTHEVARQALHAMKAKHQEAMAALETEEGWYTERDYYQARKLNSELVSEPTAIGDLEDHLSKGVIKLLFRHPLKTSAILAQGLQGLPVHCTWSFDSLLEVSARDVTKAKALRWVTTQLGLEAADVVAFGDQNNDKEMLAWVGFGVAMANAVQEAKAAADFVTLSNDDDGVAVVLENWL